MTAKAEVLELIRSLPEAVNFEEIVQQVEALASFNVERDGSNFGEGYALRDAPAVEPASRKMRVLESVQKLDENSSFEDIIERIRVLVLIQEGLDSLDRLGGIPIDEVEKMMASWITK